MNMVSEALLAELRQDMENGDFDQDLFFDGVTSESDIDDRLYELYLEHVQGENTKRMSYYIKKR